MRNFVGQWSNVKQWQNFCAETLKKVSRMRKNGFKKHLSALFRANFFMFALLISNYTVFLVQFEINSHLWVFQKAEIVFWKTHSWKWIPNWTRNRMITLPILKGNRTSLPRVVPCFPLLGLAPSGIFMGLSSTSIYTSELILCFHYLCSQCYAAQHSYVPLKAFRLAFDGTRNVCRCRFTRSRQNQRFLINIKHKLPIDCN